MAFIVNFVTPRNIGNATTWIQIPESLQFTAGGKTAAGGASILGAVAIGETGIGFDECVQESSGVLAIFFQDIHPVDKPNENAPILEHEYHLPANIANANFWTPMILFPWPVATFSDFTWQPMNSTTASPCAEGSNIAGSNAPVDGALSPGSCLLTKSVMDGAFAPGSCLQGFTSLLGAEGIPRCAAEWNGCQLTHITPPPTPPIAPPPVLPPHPPNIPPPSTLGSGFQCEIIFQKAPQDIVDFSESWSNWLIGSDTIVSTAWAADPGITIVSSSFTATTTTVVISGGTAGQIYALRGAIATGSGRIELRSALVYVLTCNPSSASPPSKAATQCFRVAPKNPASAVDVQISWASYLAANDYIVSSSWIGPGGIGVGSSTYTLNSASVRVSGGVSGTNYAITNIITTALGQTAVRRVEVEVGTCLVTNSTEPF